MYEIIKKCRICNNKKLYNILDLGNQPPSNSFRKSLDLKLPNIPLVLKFCKRCELAQLSATADPKELFKHYFWVTNTSQTAKDYSEIFCRRVLKRTKRKNILVIEIASNDGTFLKPFIKKKNYVLGIDPAVNICRDANKKGIKTICDFFSNKLALKILKQQRKKADVVFARNVIPHVKNIKDIIKGISNLVSKDGLVAIEFHYSKIIQDELHYDSIYHEHLFYFTIKTISTLFKRYKLYSFDVDKSPISGGSLVLYFSKSKKDISARLKRIINIEKKEKINSYKSWINFSIKSILHAKKLIMILKRLKKKYPKIPIIGYGASARSATLLNFSKINNVIVNKIIDKNILKKDMYTPGSNIKVQHYNSFVRNLKKIKVILILAWNFKKEIIMDLRSRGFSGQFILPLPNKIKII